MLYVVTVVRLYGLKPLLYRATNLLIEKLIINKTECGEH